MQAVDKGVAENPRRASVLSFSGTSKLLFGLKVNENNREFMKRSRNRSRNEFN